jgi:MOSC domain-containing protein YiiM
VNLEGDDQADRSVHGGYDKAVYSYAREDIDWWEGELGKELPNGIFGENLTLRGIDLRDALIGERWRIGSTLLQVRSPRIPCRTFAGFWEVPDLIKRFTAHGASGAYLRVIRDGDVGAGDPVEVVSRPAHGVTIGETFRALTGESALLPRLLDAEQLPADTLRRVRRRVAATKR